MTHSNNVAWSPPLISAVLIGLLIRMMLLLVTPIGGTERAGQLSSYNDEIAHVNYAKFIVENRRLPTQVESIQAANALSHAAYENYQPPLYYVALAGIANIFGWNSTNALALLGRVISFACALAILWILLRISDTLQLDKSKTAAVVFFWSLNGVLVRFSVTAGNDALFWLFAGGMLLLALRMDQPVLITRDLVLFTIVTIAALYTKLSALLLLPLPLIALRHKPSTRTCGSFAAAYIAIFAATLLLWMRNAHSFGSLVPLDAGFGQAVWRLPDWTAAAYAIRSLIFPWQEFWHGFAGLLFMLPLICVMVWSLISRSNRRLLFRAPVLIAAFAVVFSAFLWLNMRYNQAEARYLFAAWPALAVWFSPRAERPAAHWLLLLVYLLPFALFWLPLSR